MAKYILREDIKMNKSDKKAVLLRVAVSLVLLALLFLIVYFILRIFGIQNITKENIEKFVGKFGAWAPIIFIFISFLQVTFIPIPSTVTVLAGSYLFGAVPSFFYSFIGITLGAFVAFILGRVIGRRFVAWVVGGEERLDMWQRKLVGREHALLWIMFFAPLFPDDALCAVAGLVKISYLEFAAMQFITRTISIGSTLFLMSGEIIPYHGWGLALIIVIGVLFTALSVLSLIYYEKVADFINKITLKIRKK